MTAIESLQSDLRELEEAHRATRMELEIRIGQIETLSSDLDEIQRQLGNY